MSKTKIVITTIVVIGIVTAIITLQVLSKRTVTLELQGDFTAELYDGTPDDGTYLSDITGGTTLSLKDGYYCAVPKDERYVADATCFAVFKQDKDVTLTPAYSAAYLATLLTEAEQNQIQSLLENTYGAILDGFDSAGGSLVVNENWYVGALTQKTKSRSEQGDTYRFILHKVGDAWQVAAKPQLVISSPDFPDVPKTVVEAANNL